MNLLCFRKHVKKDKTYNDLSTSKCWLFTCSLVQKWLCHYKCRLAGICYHLHSSECPIDWIWRVCILYVRLNSVKNVQLMDFEFRFIRDLTNGRIMNDPFLNFLSESTFLESFLCLFFFVSEVSEVVFNFSGVEKWFQTGKGSRLSEASRSTDSCMFERVGQNLLSEETFKNY